LAVFLTTLQGKFQTAHQPMSIRRDDGMDQDIEMRMGERSKERPVKGFERCLALHISLMHIMTELCKIAMCLAYQVLHLTAIPATLKVAHLGRTISSASCSHTTTIQSVQETCTEIDFFPFHHFVKKREGRSKMVKDGSDVHGGYRPRWASWLAGSR
jgi:hypothetical protein